MGLLVLGLALFIGIHLIPSIRPLRAALTARLSEDGYKGLFALVALSSLGLIIWGKSQAPFVHVFLPPMWGRNVTLGLLLLSSVSFAAMYLPTNLKRFTAHPMLWGTALWGTGHLLANGDLGSLLLFGSITAFSIFDMWSSNRRGAQPKTQKVSLWRDTVVVLVGTASFLALLFGHPYAFGVSALGG